MASDQVQLDPPIGTCYFKSYQQRFPVSVGTKIAATITITFYIYVTLAKPDDPNFTAKNGKVIIVAVYDGWIKNVGTKSDIFGFMEIYTNNLPPPPMYQLPVAGTEEVRGDTRIYTIDFAQTMSMYNNGGNSSFNFSALYKRIYTLKGYSQNMYENTRAGWSLDLDTHAETHDTTRVAYGVQVYETNKLAAPECTLYFNYIWDDGTFEGHSTTFILDYSAETMAKAEVG